MLPYAPYPFYAPQPLLYHMPFMTSPSFIAPQPPFLQSQAPQLPQPWLLSEAPQPSRPSPTGQVFPGLTRPLDFEVESDLDGCVSLAQTVPPSPSSPGLVDEWRLYLSPEGHPYYFNHSTNESIWALDVDDHHHHYTDQADHHDYTDGGDNGDGGDDNSRVGWLSRVSSMASIIASAIEPATPRSAASETPRSVLNDLSLPERLAGRVATLLERGVDKLQGNHPLPDVLHDRVPRLVLEEGLEEGWVSGTEEGRKYQPASELRRQGLLPPLPPPGGSAVQLELPPPSPRCTVDGAQGTCVVAEEV